MDQAIQNKSARIEALQFAPNLPALKGVVVRLVQIDLECNKCQFAIASAR